MHILSVYAIKLAVTAAAIFPIASFWKFRSIKVIECISLEPRAIPEHPLVTFETPCYHPIQTFYATITNSMEYLTKTMLFQTNLPKDLVNLVLEYMPNSVTSIFRTSFEDAVFCGPGGADLEVLSRRVAAQLLYEHESNGFVRSLDQAKARLEESYYNLDNIEFFMPALKSYWEVANKYLYNVRHFNKLLLMKVAGASFALYALDKAIEFEEYYWDSDNAFQAGIKLHNNLGKIKEDIFLISALQHFICDTIGDQGISKTICVEATNMIFALPKSIVFLSTDIVNGVTTMMHATIT